MIQGSRMNIKILPPIVLAICLLLSAGISSAAELITVITADSLEYEAKTREYQMSGNVTVTRGDAVVKADEITYAEDTSEMKAAGNVRYDDRESSVRAARAEFNLDAKSGRLHDAELLYRKNNYHLSGKTIEKKGENYYYSPEARFTTCDTPVPDWCFRGKEINAVMGETIKARDTSLLLRDLPVFYAPYLQASLNTERHTGFLIPIPGYSKSRGISLNMPYYWAIAENRDATFVFDYFSKRGLGTGVEYRFVEPGGIRSSWWAYHIRDTELDRDFLEVRALHEDRDRGNISRFLDINYVNEKDYYREFNSYREIRIQRFLESTGEASMTRDNSRLYLLSQYRVDLQQENGLTPQKLPEAGYVLNYTRVGDFMLGGSVTAANLYREDAASAARLDIYPRLLHRFGTDVTVTQTVGLRDTSYAFYHSNDGDATGNTLRGAFEYDIITQTRLIRRFPLLTHIVEPSLRYHFVYSPKSTRPGPVYDETDLFGRTSAIELSLLNRGIIKGSEALEVRMTQGVDTYGGDRPFLPLHIEAGIRTPVTFLLDSTYDYYAGRVESVHSDLGVNVSSVNLSFGQRFNRKEDINVFTTGAGFNLSKEAHIDSSLWYDAKGAGLRDVNVSLKYTRQCWSLHVEAIKRPGDFSVKFMVELTGITSRPPAKDRLLQTD